MEQRIVYVDEVSGIPLTGIDFIGIIDRGTNVLEIKPSTMCNLKCKYCFVSSGDYETDFIVSSQYLLEQLRRIIRKKGEHDIEIHIAPYGESLLYPELLDFISSVKLIEGIKTISMQSNALLLNSSLIKELDTRGLSRINVSMNTLNKEIAEDLCQCDNYEIDRILSMIIDLLASNIDVLVAPVWIPGKNDRDIEEIIKFVVNLRNQGYSNDKIRIGVQKYLVYKTGRKLKRVHPKSWAFFYHQLTQLEKKYQIKLKLGPSDFQIHKRTVVSPVNFHKNQILIVKVISKGRWFNECLCRTTEDIGIKVILRTPLKMNTELLNRNIEVKIISANKKNNIYTAIYPIN
jgi:uncharacterized Fe-S cluster-containing radical SAM superfamily enzyme